MLDQAPKSEWPVPLVEGEHFLSLGAASEADTCVASDQQYSSIPRLIDEFLSDEKKRNRILVNNGRYFDCNLAPDAVGKYVCAHVMEARRTHSTQVEPV